MRQVVAKGGKADPEDRLPGMMIAAPFIPICQYHLHFPPSFLADFLTAALFIFGWTSPPYVMPGGGNWVGPCISGVPFGFGMVVVYFSANAYLIDTFPSYVASALAAKTVVRSGMGAAMPLFMVQMFHGLGNGWAASLLAFVSLAMVSNLHASLQLCVILNRSQVPIPFLFYRYGKSIRARSQRGI